MYGQNDRDKVRIMNAKQLNKSFLLPVLQSRPLSHWKSFGPKNTTKDRNILLSKHLWSPWFFHAFFRTFVSFCFKEDHRDKHTPNYFLTIVLVLISHWFNVFQDYKISKCNRAKPQYFCTPNYFLGVQPHFKQNDVSITLSTRCINC